MNAVVEMKRVTAEGALVTVSSRMDVAEVVAHVFAVQEVMQKVMKKDVHFGKIPGTPKPTLYAPGADLLGMTFHIAASYVIEDLSTADAIRYRISCRGTHQTSGILMGEGLGEASSSEEKYKWRKAVCDEEWNETPQNLRRIKYGKSNDAAGFYKQKQVRTEPADLANTVLKMAKKRAKVAMILDVLAASDMFGQDLEDLERTLREHLAEDDDTGSPQQAAQQQEAAQPAVWPDEAFANWWNQKFKKALDAGRGAADVIAWAETRGKLTPAQLKQINDYKASAGEEQQPAAADQPSTGDGEFAGAESAPVAPTYAQVASKMAAAVAAKSIDDLDAAATLIAAVVDEQQRKELTNLYEQGRAELDGAPQ